MSGIWLVREAHIFNVLDSERQLDILNLMHTRLCSFIQVPALSHSVESVDKLRNIISEVFDMAVKLATPYSDIKPTVAPTQTEHYRNELDEMKKAWENRFGMKLDDPATKLRLQQLEQQAQLELLASQQTAERKILKDRLRVKRAQEWDSKKYSRRK
jgi:hypothetical protein